MKQILINCGFVQKRAVILDNGEITDVLVEHSQSSGGVGNIYKGRVDNVVQGMQSAFVDIGLDKNAFLFADDVGDGKCDIKKLVKKGQDILVQVTKEAQGVKGARVTTDITVPGHKLVLMPQMKYIGISKKITGQERERLKKTVENLAGEGYGYIVRTDAVNATEDELKSEMEYLNNQWQAIVKNGRVKNAPCLLHDENSLFLTVIRDYFDESVDSLLVNDEASFNEIRQIALVMTPGLVEKIAFKEGNLFLSFESRLKKLLQRKVWLDSGAYLIIDYTEALTVIDVNTGKFTGTYDINKTIVKTNIAAAKEIAHQLRLRAIGGIIVVDFIDMETDEERELVLKALSEASEGDRVKTNILGFAPLGLVEMTRKKTRLSLADSMQTVCPYCEGDGRVLNELTVADNIFSELKRISAKSDYKNAVIRVNPYMLNVLRRFESVVSAFYDLNIFVRTDNGMHIEDYNISILESISEQEGLKRLK